MNERMAELTSKFIHVVKPRSAHMKIRDISPILFAGAASLWMAASAGAAPLQQDLTIPLVPRPSPDDTPDENQNDQDRIPIIRPESGRLPTTPFRPPADLVPQSDQDVVINSDFAGWESASAEESVSPVAEELRGNWIMVDSTGRFDGRVIAGKNADTANMNLFLMHMGRLVKQTTVDEDGGFVFTNVRQGAYALTGWGPRGLFTFGLNILAFNDDAGEDMPPNSITVTAYQNRTTINTDWIAHYVPQVGFRVFGRYPEGEGIDDSPALYGSVGLYNNLPANSLATSISSHVVSRDYNGSLVGRVHQFNSRNGRPVDLRSTKVLLLENDSVVAATATDNHGIFKFEEVPNGSYGVLAAGVDGVGLIGITVGDEAADSNTIDFTLIPVETVGWLNDYAAEVAYHRNVIAPRRPKPQENGAGCQFCNNQAGGCDRCQREYLESACRQKGITFEQWQVMGCQAIAGGLGQGRFVREIGKVLRNSVDSLDRFSENTFYPNDNADRILRDLNLPAGGGVNQGQFQGGFAPAPSLPPAGGSFGGSSTRGVPLGGSFGGSSSR